MGSEAYGVTVVAGLHDRRHCPVSFDLPPEVPDETWRLVHANGSVLPVQALPDGTGHFMLPELPAGTTASFTLQRTRAAQAVAASPVRIEDNGRAISIAVGGSSLTCYHYADVPARPYFYPLLTAAGREVTRAYPMRQDVAGESQDHPHHRSLWIAFGDVNSVDNWSEKSGHGVTRHDSVVEITDGDVFGRFSTRSTWLSPQDRPLLTQRLQMTAWATPAEFRMLDIAVDLTADWEPVLFGDTKEGGLLSVRVVGSMDVPRGGRIENSYGALDEAETWGKSAHWCDYSGPVGGEVLGIAVMDHPLSFRYPTHWHVRNYGLMTANPFGYAAYTSGAKRGEHLLAKGESLHFRYRLVVHSGNAIEGQVRRRYLDFVSPPLAKIVSSREP